MRYLLKTVSLCAFLYLTSFQTSGNNLQSDSFKIVTSKLDKGGTFYLYLSPRSFWSALEKYYEVLPKVVKEDKNLGHYQRQDALALLEYVKGLAMSSGLEQISGLGCSATPIENELYRTKFYVHRGIVGDNGIIWQLFKRQGNIDKLLELLPAETVFCDLGYFDINLLWNWLTKKNNATAPCITRGMMQGFTSLFLSKSLDSKRFFESFDNWWGFLITVSPNKSDNTQKLPLWQWGGKLDIAFVASVKNNYPFSVFQQLLKPYLAPSSNIASDEIVLTMPTYSKLLPRLKPIITQKKNLLFLATSRAIVKKMLAAQKEKVPQLKNQYDFVRLRKKLQGLGDGLEFLSKRSIKIVADILTRVLQQNFARRLVSTLKSLLSLDYLATWQTNKSDFSAEMISTVDPAAILLFKSLILPASFNLSMTLPAVLHEREVRRFRRTIAELQDLNIALKMYAMHHKNNFPIPSGQSGLQKLISEAVLYISPEKLQKIHKQKFNYFGGFSELSNKNLPLIFETPDGYNKDLLVMFIDGRIEVMHPEKPILTIAQFIKVLNKLYLYPENDLEKLQKSAVNLLQ